eukprot:jgi/Chlat1/6616/Chrsp466S06084
MRRVMQSVTGRITTLSSSGRRPALRGPTAPPALVERRSYKLTPRCSSDGGDVEKEDDREPKWFTKFRMEAVANRNKTKQQDQESISSLVEVIEVMAEANLLTSFVREAEFYGGDWGMPSDKGALVKKLIAVDAIRQSFGTFLPSAVKAATRRIGTELRDNAHCDLPDLVDVAETHRQLQHVLEFQGMRKAANLAERLQDLVGQHLDADVRRTLERFVFTCRHGQEAVARMDGAALNAVMWQVARLERLLPNVSGLLKVDAAGGVLADDNKHWLVMGEATSSPSDEDSGIRQLRTSLRTVKYILEACGGRLLQPLGIVLVMSRVQTTRTVTVGDTTLVIRQLRPDVIL